MALAAPLKSQIIGAIKRENSLQRGGNDFRHTFGIHERKRFRSELTEHDVKERDQEEAHRDRRACVRTARSGRHAEESKDAVDYHGDGRLADPAKGQRCDRDPELCSGDVAIEVSEGFLDVLRRVVAGFGHLVDAAAPHRHKGEFGGDEKGVGGHQQKHDAEASQDCAGAQMFGWSREQGQKIHIR